MDEHHCLLCMGSNTNRYAQLSVAREALRATFPDIHFGEMMETEAVGSGFHSFQQSTGQIQHNAFTRFCS